MYGMFGVELLAVKIIGVVENGCISMWAAQ